MSSHDINAERTELLITHLNGLQANIHSISAFVQWYFYGSVCGNLYNMGSSVCSDVCDLSTTET